MMSKLVWSFIFLIICSSDSFCQKKFWVYFTDKEGTHQYDSMGSIKSRDLDIYLPYLNKITEYGGKIHHQSRWLNAVSVSYNTADSSFINNLSSLNFIRHIQEVRKIILTNHVQEQKSTPDDLYKALKQINGKEILDAGLSGQGVSIGIIDGGFLEANREISLDDIFYDNLFTEFKNFTGDGLSAFDGNPAFSEDHGTKVWQYIGGYNRDKQLHLGLATRSNYYLAKSDHGEKEFKGEEDYWVAALEWLSSKNVRLVNSSVGFSVGFDDPNENYLPDQVDGQFSPLSRAAQIASEEKGMTLVISAGNNGDGEFKYINIPSDAEDVIAVGNCSGRTGKKLSFSSIGPSSLNYPKPDLCCYHLGGNSFTTPIITGLIACMMEADPDLNNAEIISILRKSSSLYPFPNNFVGYGTPDSKKVLELISDPGATVWDAQSVVGEGEFMIPTTSLATALVYHKRDKFTVLIEETIAAKSGNLIIKKADDALLTTVLHENKVIEIKWK